MVGHSWFNVCLVGFRLVLVGFRFFGKFYYFMPGTNKNAQLVGWLVVIFTQ